MGPGKLNAAFGKGKIPVEQFEIAAYHINGAEDARSVERAADMQIPLPFAFQSPSAHEKAARHVYAHAENPPGRRCLGFLSTGYRQFPDAAGRQMGQREFPFVYRDVGVDKRRFQRPHDEAVSGEADTQILTAQGLEFVHVQ